MPARHVLLATPWTGIRRRAGGHACDEEPSALYPNPSGFPAGRWSFGAGPRAITKCRAGMPDLPGCIPLHGMPYVLIVRWTV